MNKKLNPSQLVEKLEKIENSILSIVPKVSKKKVLMFTYKYIKDYFKHHIKRMLVDFNKHKFNIQSIQDEVVEEDCKAKLSRLFNGKFKKLIESLITN
jgi:Na+-transporting NADH:ubiquinone oxidoreductase subunit NqrC